MMHDGMLGSSHFLKMGLQYLARRNWG